MTQAILALLEGADRVTAILCEVAVFLLLPLLALLVPRRTRHLAGGALFWTSFVFSANGWIVAAAAALAVWGWVAVLGSMVIPVLGILPVGFAAAVSDGNRAAAADIGIDFVLWLICWAAFWVAARRQSRP